MADFIQFLLDAVLVAAVICFFFYIVRWIFYTGIPYVDRVITFHEMEEEIRKEQKFPKGEGGINAEEE